VKNLDGSGSNACIVALGSNFFHFIPSVPSLAPISKITASTGNILSNFFLSKDLTKNLLKSKYAAVLVDFIF